MWLGEGGPVQQQELWFSEAGGAAGAVSLGAGGEVAPAGAMVEVQWFRGMRFSAGGVVCG